MKTKLLALLLMLAMIVGVLASCGGGGDDNGDGNGPEKVAFNIWEKAFDLTNATIEYKKGDTTTRYWAIDDVCYTEDADGAFEEIEISFADVTNVIKTKAFYDAAAIGADKKYTVASFTIAGNAATDIVYNIRENGAAAGRKTTANIDIVSKTDKPGIDIIIKAGTKNESVHIPVIISESGLKDMVYNDFYIGEGADVTIIAGCGIHNCGDQDSAHDGIHSFHVGKDARVRYVERHYGEEEGTGENIMNPTTIIEIDEGGYLEMETTQIKGIDSTIRNTEAVVGKGATLIVKEKIMTHGKQHAETVFNVDLNGDGASTNVISRSVAKDNSTQTFLSKINGNSECYGHTECDAIIMDNASVRAIPEITANDINASLIHEAAIGKIAGEQIIKLMTLGLTEQEAEEQIVNGFLK